MNFFLIEKNGLRIISKADNNIFDVDFQTNFCKKFVFFIKILYIKECKVDIGF